MSAEARADRFDAALQAVTSALSGGIVAAQRIDAQWLGIETEVDEVARIARRARVLAINAAIEAAYADSLASGFGFVAERMRALSASTIEATREVHEIVAESRALVAGVLQATHEAHAVNAGRKVTHFTWHWPV